MDFQDKNYLPLWTSDFTNLRNYGSLYVDKTELICDLAKRRGFFLFSRPRRFGKSLLISTLETLFRDGIKNFYGLKIENKWNDTLYKTLKLDFSRTKEATSIESFLNKCWRMFRDGCQDGDIPFDSLMGEDLGGMLYDILYRMNNMKIVLLIDEYDAPLTANLKNPKLFEEIQHRLSSLYSVIKSKNKAFRFVLLTGIAKFNQASIFSGFNILIDISLEREYGELLGYTEEEVSYYFRDYISDAANIKGVTKEKILEDLRDEYGGYCFDRGAYTHVYNPWSVLNFCESSDKEIENYWYNSSGSPLALLDLLENKNKFDIFYYFKFYFFDMNIEDLRQLRDIKSLRDDILLIQTGYLTIKESDIYNITVGYPNKEVESSMAKLAITCMIDGTLDVKADIYNLKEHFLNGNISGVIASFNNAFLNIPHRRYPVANESMCRDLVILLLRGAQVSILPESPNAHGRICLEAVEGKNHWVLEFKFIANGAPKEDGRQNGSSSLPELSPLIAWNLFGKDEEPPMPVTEEGIAMLAGALEQMRKRKCGEGFLPGHTLIRVAMVFSQKDKRFVEWETYPLTKRADALARKGRAEALACALRKQGWDESMLLPLCGGEPKEPAEDELS